MGIYTSNRYLNGVVHDYASEIPANEAYDAAFGCAHILADCQANDMALFESTIYSDFAEVKALQEGFGYVNENVFTDTLKKIAEMFKKLLAKIKGIFAAFIAKLTGAFKDGKKLVKQYEKQIIKYSNWKDFKCKGIRKPNSGKENILNAIATVFAVNDGIPQTTYAIKIDSSSHAVTIDTGLKDFTAVDKIKDAESSDIKVAIANKYLGGGVTISELSEFNENVSDYLYEEAGTIDGEDDNVNSSYFSAVWIKEVLNEDKWEKNVKKVLDRLEKNINVIIDNLKKDEDKLVDAMAKDSKAKIDTDKFGSDDSGKQKMDYAEVEASGSNKVGKNNYNASYSHVASGSDGAEAKDIQAAIHALQTVASHEQEVISKVSSECMAQVKFAMAQARKVWTAAAAWSSGVHKESVEYVNAVAECAAEQLYMNMEAVH